MGTILYTNHKKMEHHFSLQYPDAISLNMSYYENEKYNKIRRCKLILFSNCLGNNEKFLKNYLHNAINKKKQFITNEFLTSCGINTQTIKIINEYLYTQYLTKEYIIKYLERGCLSRSIEKAKLYNIRCVWTDEKFVYLYHSICYKVSSNLDPSSCIQSDYILTKILNKDVELINIANMTSKELCPSKNMKLTEKNEQKN